MLQVMSVTYQRLEDRGPEGRVTVSCQYATMLRIGTQVFHSSFAERQILRFIPAGKVSMRQTGNTDLHIINVETSWIDVCPLPNNTQTIPIRYSDVSMCLCFERDSKNEMRELCQMPKP